MTAEGSQSAPVNPESAQSAPAKASTSGNQQLRIAILVVVAALVGVGLWLAFGNSSNKHHPKNKGKGAVTTAIGPVAFSKARLAKQPNIIDQPIYWAGPKKGYHYEFWRLKNDQVYVRYLPQNVKAGAPGKKYLIIGTYPFANAYHALKKQSHGRVTKGPNGSIIWTSSSDPHSVYIAWPGRRYQIEVYDPKASTAAAIAANGDVAPIG